ncbi:MAG TPA: DUF4917 family protein [Solirubrobacterales bacterium]|nr:DUF4917 family protein [Solirubrobacterales bacterium]
MALADHPIDGGLPTWQEVMAERDDWSGLLLGNGLSRHIWGDFAYPSLFDTAQHDHATGSLTDADRSLFKALETKNFERVLAELAAAIRMAEVLGEEAGPYLERYQSIQLALGRAVQSVHIGYSAIPEGALESIGSVLQEQDYVFTTNYDLIVYWAMRAVDYAGLCDCFWGNGYSFDPADAEPPDGKTPIYFLHGALHLVVMGSGVTRKLVQRGSRAQQTSLRSLLSQFGRPLDGDEQARPLLITEGSAQHKLQAIEGNDYLADALGRLRNFRRPLVVFGSDLSEQDQHLVEAVNRHPSRPLAVSIVGRGRSDSQIRSIKAGLCQALEADTLLFFDAATHPLGLAALSAGRRKIHPAG